MPRIEWKLKDPKYCVKYLERCACIRFNELLGVECCNVLLIQIGNPDTKGNIDRPPSCMDKLGE